MDRQFDISREMKKLFELKQKQRSEAKEYFRKLLYNPYRPANDGVPFDPAITRFHALNTYRSQLFHTNPTFYFKLAFSLSPIIIILVGIIQLKKQKEEKFRSGLVKYEDRFNKFFF